MSSPRRRAVGEHLGQRRDVAQPEVQPLPRQRVDAVRRVAGQRHPRQRPALGERQAERIGVALALERDVAEEVAEPRPELGEVAGRRRAGRSPRARSRALGPDDRRAVAGQRQDGERPRRHEELVRDARGAAARARPRRPARSGRSPSRAGRCRRAPPRRSPARRSRRAATPGELGPVGERHRRRPRADRLADHRRAGAMLDRRRRRRAPRAARRRRKRSSTICPIGPSSISWPSKCRNSRDAPSPGRPSLIRIASIGCACGRERPPEPERRQQPLRAERQRIGPPVEPRLRRARSTLSASSTMLRHPGLRQRQRQHRAVQPAADDQHVAVASHARHYRPPRPIVQRAAPG